MLMSLVRIVSNIDEVWHVACAQNLCVWVFERTGKGGTEIGAAIVSLMGQACNLMQLNEMMVVTLTWNLHNVHWQECTPRRAAVLNEKGSNLHVCHLARFLLWHNHYLVCSQHHFQTVHLTKLHHLLLIIKKIHSFYKAVVATLCSVLFEKLLAIWDTKHVSCDPSSSSRCNYIGYASWQHTKVQLQWRLIVFEL